MAVLGADGALMALAGGVAAGGVALIVLPGPPRRAGVTARRVSIPRLSGGTVARLVVGVAVGALVWWATGWPVGGLAGLAAVVGLPVLLAGPSQSLLVGRLEAIAGWTEAMRDVMVVAKGLNEALPVTAAVSTGVIAEPLRRMEMRLKASWTPADALRALADEIDDPMADMVIAPLVMAAEQDAEQIGEILDALAVEARAEAGQRREVDAVRASARSEMRMVAIGSVSFMVLFWVIGRSTPLFQWYSSFFGQLWLAVVVLLIGTGVWLMARMVRPSQADRIVLLEQR